MGMLAHRHLIKAKEEAEKASSEPVKNESESKKEQPKKAAKK